MNANDSLITVYTPDKRLPSEITINNTLYRLKKQRGKTFKYYPADPTTGINNGVVFFQINSLPLEKLPIRICVNKRPFLQRMGGYYTPENNFLPGEISFYFNSIASKYEKTINLPLNKQVIFYLLSKIIKACPQNKELKILDYGIGTGLSSDVISLPQYSGQVKLYGVDISEKMVEKCKRKGIEKVKQNSYHDIDFPSNYFEGILSTFVVHYFIDPIPLQLMSRVLKMNGILAFNLHRSENGYYDYYSKILGGLGFLILTKEHQRPINVKIEKNIYETPFMVAKKVRKVNYPAFQLPLRL